MDFNLLRNVPLNFEEDTTLLKREKSMNLITDSFKKDVIAEANAFNREIYGIDLSQENIETLMKLDVSKLHKLVGDYSLELKKIKDIK